MSQLNSYSNCSFLKPVMCLSSSVKQSYPNIVQFIYTFFSLTSPHSVYIHPMSCHINVAFINMLCEFYFELYTYIFFLFIELLISRHKMME